MKIESFTAVNGVPLDYLYWNNNDNLRYSDWQNTGFKVSESGDFSVTVVDGNGCKASDQISVSAFIPETLELGLPRSFCENTGITLENPVAGALDYKWYLLSASSEELLIQNSSLDVNHSGTYLLKVTDANGCYISDQVVVNENLLPQVEISGDTEECGQTTLFAVSPDLNLNYEWNDTPGYNSSQIVVEQPGTYQLTVWDANGCSAQDQIDVVIHPVPTVHIDDQSACEGETITMSAPVGFEKYLWSTGDATLNIEINNAGVFALEVTDANGCVAKDEAKVTFIKPIAIDLGEDKEDCIGSSITLMGDDQHHSWEWIFTSSESLESKNISSSNHYEITNSTVLQSGIYHVNAIDVNGCAVSDEVELIFYSASPPLLSTTKSLCQGETIDVTATTGYDSYNWYLNGVEQTEYAGLSQLNNIDVAGIYRVEATKGACVIQNEIEVVNHDLPQVTLPENVMLCHGVETELAVENFQSGNGIFSYLYWNDIESVHYGDWRTASFPVDNEGRYSVTVVDEYGCKATDYIDVLSMA